MVPHVNEKKISSLTFQKALIVISEEKNVNKLRKLKKIQDHTIKSKSCINNEGHYYSNYYLPLSCN